MRLPNGAFLLLATVMCAGPLFAQAPATDDVLTELSKLQDVELRLVRFVSDGKQVALPPSITITLTFRQGGQISGRSAVNNYAGRFNGQPNGDIAIQLTTSTQMAGPPELMQLEKEYLDALSRVSHFQVKPDQLILETKSTSMTFASSHSK